MFLPIDRMLKHLECVFFQFFFVHLFKQRLKDGGEGATLCGEELLLESAKIAREIEMIEDIKNI